MFFRVSAFFGCVIFSTACRQIDCKPDEFKGTYLSHYEETNGTCGPIPDSLVSDMTAQTAAPGCTVDANRVSDDQCTRETSAHCVLANGNTVLATGKTEQVEDDGSRLEGIVTYTISRAGIVLCQGTYEITATRQ